MCGSYHFQEAQKPKNINFSVLLRSVADSDKFFGMLPIGSCIQPPVVIKGELNKDCGHRDVVVREQDAEAFLKTLIESGLADCIYRVEPRALRPVQAPVPSSTP